MLSTFQKLNLKNHASITVLDAPESFEAELAVLPDVTIQRSPDENQDIHFALAFVTNQAQVHAAAKAIAQRSSGDAVVWFAYPKGSSRRYKSEISRDRGWQILGDLGFEPVRSVAIDEDWSAIRFRRVEFIKQMTRAMEHRMTEQGKARSART